MLHVLVEVWVGIYVYVLAYSVLFDNLAAMKPLELLNTMLVFISLLYSSSGEKRKGVLH